MAVAPRRRAALLLWALLAGAGAQAQGFEVALGGDRLGRLDHTVSGGDRRLDLTLDSTPFGVFDGSYAGRSLTAGPTIEHTGRSRSSRRARDLALRLENFVPRAVQITPASERSALSTAAAVTRPVLDPVSGFGRLLETEGCPAMLRIYDGRRVGLLRPQGARRAADRVTCEARFEVVEGPGYLAPLGLSRIGLELVYDASGTAWRLMGLTASSGPFRLSFARDGG